MPWEHQNLLSSGELLVKQMATGTLYNGRYRLEDIATGKTRVFWGYRLTISFSENVTIGEDRSDMLSALYQCKDNLQKKGFEIKVVGLMDSFSESALSANSGYGYIRGSKKTWHIMTDIMSDTRSLSSTNLQIPEAKMPLNIKPCLDSDARAATWKNMLDISWSKAAKLGHSAVEAINQGYYLSNTGIKVDWAQDIQAACRNKISIPPTTILPLLNRAIQRETSIQVTNEPTLTAAHGLFNSGLRPLVLNFANGIKPGGHFLEGSRAQEENLCRSSALYATLVDDPMYADHKTRPRPDSSDWVIYSPDVPVFRNDKGITLEQVWPLSILTCAAPYAPDIGQADSAKLLRQRIYRVLEVAQAYDYSTLVLGAWGCGAFGNDPRQTAMDFRTALENEFNGVFSDVVFAITDWSPERKFLGPFCEVFNGGKNNPSYTQT